MRTRHMWLSAQGRRCPQTPYKRGTLGCDKGADERAYPWGAISPLDGCVRRREKGRNSMGCLFLFFFSTIGTKRGLGGSTEGYEASASTTRRSSSRSGTIVPRSADNETLRGQLSLLLLLRRWLVLAFIVSLIVLVGALFFAGGEAYGQDGGDSTTTSGDSGGGRRGCGGGGGGSTTTSAVSGGGKGASGGGGGDSTTTSGDTGGGKGGS